MLPGARPWNFAREGIIMLRSITLQNFKSFGTRQEVPLEPITLLVGPNNSGKSNFLSVPGFINNALVGGSQEALMIEGGAGFLVHQPATGNREIELGWEADAGSCKVSLKLSDNKQYLVSTSELLSTRSAEGSVPAWAWIDGEAVSLDGNRLGREVFGPLRWAMAAGSEQVKLVAGVFRAAPCVKLSLDCIKADSQIVEDLGYSPDGTGIAAILSAWRGGGSELSRRLDEFVHACVDEIQSVVVKPAPKPGHVRLWIRQKDQTEFDATHASDGLLYFTGLAMHVLLARPGVPLFIEEPENGIHPRRLHELVELMRKAVTEHGCQIVMATHSPVLLNEFRDEPESIILFRRGARGTEVKRCTEVPAIVKALRQSMPGELLETAFFDALWPEER